MIKKKLLANKWYILYALVPIIFFIGTVIAVQVRPNLDSMLIYGVKSVEHEQAAGVKLTKMVLTNDEIIEKPTMADIREHNLLTYHSDEELNDNLSFSTSMLN